MSKETAMARHVRRQLASLGMSMVALSEETGIERSQLYGILKARRPHANTLRRIAHAINVDPKTLAELVEDQDKKEDPN